jgi:poly-gamma-glutamate synthesis protein (capsule biosynthesis protein)
MKIALIGDVALFGRHSLQNGVAATRYFDEVAKYLSGYDHVVANLETPFVAGGKPAGAKSAYIQSRPADVELLRRVGIDVVNLANNHIFDFGAKGYACTRETLARAGISAFGAEDEEVDLVDATARVVLHGYCAYNTNPLGVRRERASVGVNALDVPTVEARMREHAANGYLNIVSVHSGWEHVNFPSREDILMARRLSRVCPFVYYGHHPHVVQGAEERNGSLLAYSLGNFCFDDGYTEHSAEPLIRQSENNRIGMILGIEVQADQLVSHSIRFLYQGADKMVLDPPGAAEAFDRYSAALAADSAEYERMRRGLIHSYLGERKARRDLQWYWRRMRLRYVELILRAKLNQRAQHRCVGRHVDGVNE